MSLDVLLVDDSAVMRKMLKRTLTMTGLHLGRVDEARDGQDGLEKLQGATYHLALVDVNMPRMNGIELLDAMSADETLSDTPVIVVSSEASEKRTAEFAQRGVGFIRKPFSPEMLVEAVIAALSGGALVDDGGEYEVGPGAMGDDGPDF